MVGERGTEPDVQVLNPASKVNGHSLNGGHQSNGAHQYESNPEAAMLENSYLLSGRKRAFDLIITFIMLPFLIPAAVICWTLVMISMGSPAIFAQHRVGLNGKVFVLYKFRSLKRDSDTRNGTGHSYHDITPVGRFLRLFRLDELPQIYNILRGEMSWVGPRPEIPYYVEMYGSKNPEFHLRHKALPGITGLAQVRKPDATPNDNLEKMKHDLQYIREASLINDIRILISTAFVIINK